MWTEMTGTIVEDVLVDFPARQGPGPPDSSSETVPRVGRSAVVSCLYSRGHYHYYFDVLAARLLKRNEAEVQEPRQSVVRGLDRPSAASVFNLVVI